LRYLALLRKIFSSPQVNASNPAPTRSEIRNDYYGAGFEAFT